MVFEMVANHEGLLTTSLEASVRSFLSVTSFVLLQVRSLKVDERFLIS